jgi:hypothetical protein
MNYCDYALIISNRSSSRLEVAIAVAVDDVAVEVEDEGHY